MQTTVNGTTFLIDLFDEGWGWVTTDNEESDGYFPSTLEALENAMQHVRAKRAAERADAELAFEEARYGTYAQQHWKRDF